MTSRCVLPIGLCTPSFFGSFSPCYFAINSIAFYSKYEKWLKKYSESHAIGHRRDWAKEWKLKKTRETIPRRNFGNPDPNLMKQKLLLFARVLTRTNTVTVIVTFWCASVTICTYIICLCLPIRFDNNWKYLFFILTSHCITHSRVGRRNLVLRHSFHH